MPAGTDPSAPAPIRNVLYRFSTDHGKTWAPAKEIDQGNAGFQFDRKWSLIADPHSDNLYAVWYGNPDPRATRPTADRDIYMHISHDSGKTWTDRQVINTDSALVNVQHYDPTVTVAPNGRVDVVWYDGRNSPTPEFDLPSGNAGGSQDVYYRYSMDHGKTFSTEVKVTDRIIDRNYGVWSNNNHVHGPIGIVSTNDAAYITWQDSRNGHDAGSADDSYFASVLFNGGKVSTTKSKGVPGALLVAVGVAIGLGVSMAVVVLFGRSKRPAGARPN